MNKETPLLVIGAGSIGERHITILQRLGYKNIFVFRKRDLPLRTIQSSSVHIFKEWDEVKHIKPEAAFICTPTSHHLLQAIECASLGIHLLVEKPLSSSLSGIEDLKKIVAENNIYLQVAYMLRYHPLMQQLKKIILENIYGNLISFQTYWGEYLPGWHPWEDYRNSYAARKELGGGVTLTLSHDIDLVLWLVDKKVVKHNIIKNYISGLEVDVESGADINFLFENGVTGHSHLNFYEKVTKRNYRFVFENASVEIDYFKNEINIYSKNNNEIINLKNFDRNIMFEEQCKNFLSTIKNFKVAQSIQQIENAELIISICNN